ncbi:hypothetical protein LAZ67_X004078 [Cordylochernes scorpioides]|uniref:Reverse transcriptase n=1 Tax=Cordylochernes scorpioides TaxID=51811 RepID=A0ABY6LUX1_9ARAC|nr:hypothetical protein LAZ67_X004078 [Cordylochernes scorpioides]
MQHDHMETTKHVIDCIDSSNDELYSSPADTIKSLKLYKLDTGFKILRKDRPSADGGGGLLTLIKDLSFEEIVTPSTTHTELQAFKIHLPNQRPLTIVNTYHPPQKPGPELDLVAHLLDPNILILGDSNSKHQSWGCSLNNTEGSILSTFIDDNNLTIVSHGPTYISHSYGTPQTLDLTITSPSIQKLIKNSTLKSIRSGHLPLLTEISTSTSLPKSSQRLFWNYKKASWDSFRTSIDSLLCKIPPQHFSKPFQEHEPDEALSHLDPTKAPGPDNITGPMLKNLSSHAKLELLSIFNYSWSSSILPKGWKHATIIPIYKPGKPENHPTNYRPIYLTSIPCKIIEHMILNSIEDSIFYFVQQIQDSFHHKPTKSTIAAFIDLSQAFDRVWKEKLILKLDELRIEGSMLSWISNFLSKRTIQVNFNNIKSKTTRIYQGLPQGSILSPIHFNIYLNDVHTFIKPPDKIALYADDIIIWVTKNNLSDAEHSLNKVIKNLQKVTQKLKLSINISKSEIGLFTINNHLSHWTPNISLNNSIIQYSDSPRYLAKNRLKILKKNISLNWGANANILRTTYLALIRPILEYATPAWINASKTNLSKIDRIQASAAKIISGLRGSCPNRIAELESNLLPLHLRRKICFSKFITKNINFPKENLTGKYIRNWVPNQRLKCPTSLNLAHNSNLLDNPINPKHRTSYPPHRTRKKLTCFPHLPANPHKHETQPELLKALLASKSLRKIAPSSTSQFTLTVANLKLDCLAILEKISLFHPKHLSVYKLELSAIDTALKDININSPSKIIIYSNSRAAIQSCFSSQEPLLKSIAKCVNRLPANSSVTVQWLPAHVGIPGNELADSLAKAGALGLPEARESTTQLDERDLLRTIKTQCLAGGTKTGSVLPREQQSLISRLKSGHLRKMTF